jgi:hypothetical protein
LVIGLMEKPGRRFTQVFPEPGYKRTRIYTLITDMTRLQDQGPQQWRHSQDAATRG